MNSLFVARAKALACAFYAFLMTFLGWAYGHETPSVVRARLTAARMHAKALEKELASLETTPELPPEKKSERAETVTSKLRVVRTQEEELRSSIPAA